MAERDAAQFRTVMTRLAPQFVNNKRFWLPKDTIMVLPGTLVENSVTVYSLEQNPGEIIIVFPGAYYSTLSNGINKSESVNVQTMLWLQEINVIFQVSLFTD